MDGVVNDSWHGCMVAERQSSRSTDHQLARSLADLDFMMSALTVDVQVC